MWKKVGSKQIVRDSVSSFSVSADGKLLAVYNFSPSTFNYLRTYNLFLSFGNDPKIVY